MANEAFASGKFLDAARYYLCLLRHKYDDASTLYNLSCCYARLGDAARAAQTLWLATQAGFADSALLRSAADFAAVRQEQVFAKTQAHILALLGSRGKTFYVQAPMLLKCQLHLPSDFDVAKKYPLLIGLHGRGGNSDNLSRRWTELGNQQVIFVSAEAPYSFPPTLFGKGAQFCWSPEHLDSAEWQRVDLLVVDAVRQIALTVANAYPVKATYVLGFSQGAAYAYLSAILHPEMFCGVLAFSGLFPAEQFSAEQLNKAAAQCRIFIAHGQGDMTVPIALSRNASNSLTTSGFSVTSKEFSGGHTLPLDVLREAVAWLLKTDGVADK
jgi:phospholipase/carboxylesterase